MLEPRISPSTEDIPVRDVIIIGAGPCGLALAARLCEHTPSALFTDAEHARYHWIRKQGTIRRKSTMDRVTQCHKRSCNASLHGEQRLDTLVLDASADHWLARWNHFFQMYDITHLRSPMFFHVDPSDRDGLLAFAHECGMDGDLSEIAGCVGKEISKHKMKKRSASKNKRATLEAAIDERDRQDYFTPSQRLFSQHCKYIVERYGLGKDIIRQEVVTDVDFGIMEHLSDTDAIFTLRTNKGFHFARAVVLAVGPGNQCTIPSCPTCDVAGSEAGECHSMEINEFPSAVVKEKIRCGRQTNIVIVGGGLTAAQLADLSVRSGITHVWMVVRSELKVKPFDFDLAWMGKYKNHEKSVFWSADSDEERLDQIRMARNGGSITTPYHKILKNHVNAGKISIHTNTVVMSRTWNQSTRTWHITLHSPRSTTIDLPPIDYIYYATGIASNISTLPYLETMLSKFPLRERGGLACVTDDLMWNKDVPLFVTGKLAGLKLGPGAGNLEGARVGAERIAWAIEEMLGGQRMSGKGGEEGSVDGDAFNYTVGAGDRFGVLRNMEE